MKPSTTAKSLAATLALLCSTSAAIPETPLVASTTTEDRNLQATFDFFDINVDLCDNRVNYDDPELLGPCDTNRFPNCSDKTQICYNRKPSRDSFHPDSHQPVYIIQYDRVFCYPDNWGGCSSCTPGRYCQSEQRCILEELNYPCEQWF